MQNFLYISILIFMIWFIVFIFSKSKYIFLSKGERGEEYVKEQIGKDIPGVQYSIHNYQVSVSDRSMQIDHIVINKYGVHVIETKNYDGEIYGSDNQYNWTQKFNYFQGSRYKTKSFTFYNPVKQNNTHIMHLNRIINMKIPYANFVVFINDNISNVNSKYIVPFDKLNLALNTPLCKKTITSSQIIEIYNKLIEYQQENIISDNEHIRNINAS